MKSITITTINSEFSFHGIHRKDLEKPNWRYFELVDGSFFHLRKEHIVSVHEKVIDKQG